MKILKLIIAIWFFVIGVFILFMSLAIISGGSQEYSSGAGILGLLVSIPWMCFFWRWIKETIGEIENKK